MSSEHCDLTSDEMYKYKLLLVGGRKCLVEWPVGRSA